MKKLGLVVAVLMLASPVWARVDIKCANDGNLVTVSYAVVGEPNRVSGFGLNITVDNGAKIKSISDINPKYWVYPGSIAIDTTVTPPVITDNGSPVRDPVKYPGGTLGGLDTNGVSIEMGALYDPPGDNSPNAPPTSGVLLKFRVDKTANVCVTITEDPTSGGVVLTNPTLNPDVNAPKFCFPSAVLCYTGMADYAQWEAAGSPVCWCYPRQCHGDADGLKQGSAALGYMYVASNDLNVLISAWQIKDPPKGPGITPAQACADFDHLKQGSAALGYMRVASNDLNRLIAYWQVKEPPKGAGVPANCPPGNRNP